MAKKNLLLEYSEELAVNIAKLCSEYKIDSNTVVSKQNRNLSFSFFSFLVISNTKMGCCN